MQITIPGEPQGKARARTVKTKKSKTISYTPDNTVNYEALIKQIYMYEIKPKALITKPVTMLIKAYFSIPKSTTKSKRIDMLYNNIRPTKKPDADNIAKIICDALNGIAYKDDTQVVSLTVEKWYTEENPRVEVGILEVG